MRGLEIHSSANCIPRTFVNIPVSATDELGTGTPHLNRAAYGNEGEVTDLILVLR